jgi:transposase
MPALVAIRFNADMKAKYQALIAAGKPPKVAIVAVMRKLAILANALLREQRNWKPKPLDQDGYSSVLPCKYRLISASVWNHNEGCRDGSSD